MLRLEVLGSQLVTILRCSGRIVHGDGADTLLRAVKAAMTRHISIDLQAVDTIDAAGLGALAELERWAREENRTIHVLNFSRQVREALEATGLSSALQILSASETAASVA